MHGFLAGAGVDPEPMGGWPEWNGSRLDLTAAVDGVLTARRFACIASPVREGGKAVTG